MLTRLDRVRPFALHETMLPAAALLPTAQVAIERFLGAGRRELRQRLHGYLRWLDGAGRTASPARAQDRFAGLRWRFNDLLSQFDVFHDAITQRSEHETGVWLSGLDVAAVDALSLPARFFDPPPVICYLDRGPGGAIRRARTRLPGGGRNPVAIIRIPRERMVGHGIAASLVHEVGHQAAALLGLVRSVRLALRPLVTGRGPRERVAWSLWSRWISEVLADFWAVGKLGIAGTLGLMSVVSLPRWFVFRVNPNDPHPVPWIRVQASAALGALLHPDRQWRDLAELWRSYYPVAGSAPEVRETFAALLDTLPELAALLVGHRPGALRGAPLAGVMPAGERSSGPLLREFDTWAARPALLRAAPPTLAFAALGQARVAGRLSPEAESRVLGDLLTHWALDSTLAVARRCAGHPSSPYPITTSRRQHHERHATTRWTEPPGLDRRPAAALG